MKFHTFIGTVMSVVLGLIPVSGMTHPLAAEVVDVNPESAIQVQVVEQATTKGVDEKHASSKALRLPVYKPPKGIGAPGGRVGGGTRGDASAMAMLFALVPDHLGLTIKEQPSLYWYLSKNEPYKLVLTLNHQDLVSPILELTLGKNGTSGIHSVSLEDHKIKLELDKEYQWFVELVVDNDYPARNVVAGGRIKRITPPEPLLVKLRKADPHEVTAVYSEAGLWYDAFDSISDLIVRKPENPEFSKGRNYLLKQVDLMEVAEDEESVSMLGDTTNSYWEYLDRPFVRTVVDHQPQE